MRSRANRIDRRFADDAAAPEGFRFALDRSQSVKAERAGRPDRLLNILARRHQTLPDGRRSRRNRTIEEYLQYSLIEAKYSLG